MDRTPHTSDGQGSRRPTPRLIRRVRQVIAPCAIAFTALLLAGCPDGPTPKAPPKVPEPKAQTSSICPNASPAEVQVAPASRLAA